MAAHRSRFIAFRRMSLRHVALCCAAASCGAVGCEDQGICDAETLSSTLQRAVRGDSVRVGRCVVEGSFRIPDGVSLIGEGRESTYLTSSGPAPVLEVSPGTTATVIADLAIRSAGVAGILVDGRGHIEIARVDVQASRGLGIALESLESVVLVDVSVAGTVTELNAAEIPNEPTPNEYATHGLVLVDVREASLEQVRARGFARMGMLLVQATTDFRQGEVTQNLSTGLMVHGGEASLTDLTLCGTFEGIQALPAYDAVFAGNADVRSERIELCECDGMGLLQDSSTSSHVDLVVRENRHGGVWVQNSDGFELMGNATAFRDNTFAGVVAYQSEGIILQDGEISATRNAGRLFEDLGSVELGDGLHLVRPAGPVLLERLSLAGNDRVGMLLELEGSEPAELTLTQISVDGSGDQLGAVAQGDTTAIPENWDADVTRLGNTATNDLAPPTLSIVPDIPDDDFPTAERVASEGIDALIDR